jgi:hypothetical protein
MKGFFLSREKIGISFKKIPYLHGIVRFEVEGCFPFESYRGASDGRFEKSYAIFTSTFSNISLFQESGDPFPFRGLTSPSL